MMQRPSIAVLMLGCAVNSTAQPEFDRVAEDASRCPAYCEAMQRCWPEFYYLECPFDCVRLVSSARGSEASAITGAIVRCWSESTSCELAAACDYATEGDRK